jgi:proline iminopeptidase
MSVGEVHQLYVDESGSPDGIPVVFLHGGPGAGCEFDSRRFFDPARYRIVLVDQRGAGRSTPQGSLVDNTLAHLIDDLVKLREFLAIEQWLVFGGGFGSALALAYACRYPEHVLGLMLRGIFLGRVADTHWISKEGASRFFPDAWAEFIAPLPAASRSDPLKAYAQLMQSNNEIQRMTAAKAWSLWEARCANLRPHSRLLDYVSAPQRALTRCVIATHYLINDCFLSPDELLNRVAAIADLPGIIVQGRFDVLTPMSNACELLDRWPGAELMVVREAGHGVNDAAMIDALVSATRAFAAKIRPQHGRRS